MLLEDFKTTFYNLSKMGVKKVCLEKDKYKEFLEYVYLHSDIAGDPMYRAGNSLYPFYVFGIEVCRQQ